MGTPYIDEDAFAVGYNYANWTAYASANPNTPTLAWVTENIEEATEIINEKIGSHNVSITDVRFLSRVQKLCLRMVKRMKQIEYGQGTPGRIPLFSPNDFLQDRERKFLQSTVGVVLKYRGIGLSGV
jgi:hypothetical protein